MASRVWAVAGRKSVIRYYPNFYPGEELNFYRSTSGAGSKDPRDAAHVPPSVLAQQLGTPQIMHDDHQHNRAGRHGSTVGDDIRAYGGGHR